MLREDSVMNACLQYRGISACEFQKKLKKASC